MLKSNLFAKELLELSKLPESLIIVGGGYIGCEFGSIFSAFGSKVTKYNFIDMATKAMIGIKESGKYNTIDLDYVGIKAPQFSFSRLRGADPVSGVEMASTGEVACLGENINEAFLKSLFAVGFELPKKNILLSTGTVKDKADLLESVRKLKEMGYELYATLGTHKFLEQNGIKNMMLNWPLDKKEPNALTYLKEKLIL